jgi:hypothetical protein
MKVYDYALSYLEGEGQNLRKSVSPLTTLHVMSTLANVLVNLLKDHCAPAEMGLLVSEPLSLSFKRRACAYVCVYVLIIAPRMCVGHVPYQPVVIRHYTIHVRA